jgi:hypothetical protein
MSMLVRLGISTAAGIAAAVAAALLVTVLDLYLTGHGHGSVTREVITSAGAGVHLSIADVAMLVTGIAVAVLTWYLVGHGRQRTRMKSAAVHQLKDRILVHPWQQTDMGVGIASEPYVAIPLEVDNEQLGKSILDALGDSGRTVPHPTVWKGQDASRLKAAGVKSERAFQDGARYVRIERTQGGFLIEPSRNGGTTGDKKGFEPLPARAIALDAGASTADLGKAVRRGLDSCKQR